MWICLCIFVYVYGLGYCLVFGLIVEEFGMSVVLVCEVIC